MTTNPKNRDLFTVTVPIDVKIGTCVESKQYNHFCTFKRHNRQERNIIFFTRSHFVISDIIIRTRFPAQTMSMGVRNGQ